VTHSEESSRFI